MKTKIIILIILIAIAVIALPFLMRQKNVSAQNDASLVAEESFYDLGTIAMKDGTVESLYTLVNTGDKPVVVGKVYTSCMCTTASIIYGRGNKKGKFGMPGHPGILTRADIEVLPGDSIELKVLFDPTAHGPSGVGFAQRSVYVETNSSVTPKVELRFEAMVTN